MFQVHILDLNASNASELFHILDLNASNASELFHIIGPQCLQCLRAIPYFGPRGTATTAAAVSQELWTSGEALVQRARNQISRSRNPSLQQMTNLVIEVRDPPHEIFDSCP